jgi:hypothetical protein
MGAILGRLKRQVKVQVARRSAADGDAATA